MSQGDIFRDVLFVVRVSSEWTTEVGHVMMVSHDCEYTKTREQPERPLAVAPLVDLRDLPDGHLSQAQQDKMSRYWALPVDGPMGWPAAVDLANVQPLLAADLERAERVSSINDFGQMALAGRLFTFYAQREFGT